MKTKIILSLLGALFISGAFTEGCEEEEPKPDYIKVVVKVSSTLNTRNLNINLTSCDSINLNVPMKVVITKAGGENFVLFPSTGSEFCYFDTEPVSFNLYREQPIEVEISSEYVPAGYTQSEGYSLLEWEDVYPAKDFGETYTWNASAIVYWLYN